MRTRSDACLYRRGRQRRCRPQPRQRLPDRLRDRELPTRRLRDNVSRGNTAGIIVDVINDRLTTTCTDNVVEHNTSSTRQPAVERAAVGRHVGPAAGDQHHRGGRPDDRAQNTVTGNSLAGMTLVDFCLDRADVCAMPGLEIDPRPDGNRVIANVRGQRDARRLPAERRSGQLLRQEPSGAPERAELSRSGRAGNAPPAGRRESEERLQSDRALMSQVRSAYTRAQYAASQHAPPARRS